MRYFCLKDLINETHASSLEYRTQGRHKFEERRGPIETVARYERKVSPDLLFRGES